MVFINYDDAEREIKLLLNNLDPVSYPEKSKTESAPYRLTIENIIQGFLCVAIEGGQSASNLVKFIKSGGFKKALRSIYQRDQQLRGIDNMIRNKPMANYLFNHNYERIYTL